MIKMVLRFCYLENIPVEDSEFHRTLKAMGMQDASDRLSYERELPMEGKGDAEWTLSSLSLKQSRIS